MNESWVMDRWVELWDEDAGVIPVGVEKKEIRVGPGGEMLDIFWTFYDKKIAFDGLHGWTLASLDDLYAAQLGAAISRLSRIEGFTLKILYGGIVVVGIDQNGLSFKSSGSNTCAGDSTALLGNLATLTRWVMDNLSERHRDATDGAVKLKMGFGFLA